MITTFRDFHIHLETGSDRGATPLLLLHGTGGDENDLIEFGRMVAPSSPLLGVRGRVMEGSITRWFRRHGEGVFDLPDLERRQEELAIFIREATAHFGFANAPVALGYSNGANITAGMLMRGGAPVLSGAILMRAMAGLEPAPGLSLTGFPVLMLNGAYDPLAPKNPQLQQQFAALGADLTSQIGGPGHELTRRDVDQAAAWFAGRPALTA